MFLAATMALHSALGAAATSASTSPQVASRMLLGTKARFESVIEVEPPGHSEHCADTRAARRKQLSKQREVFMVIPVCR